MNNNWSFRIIIIAKNNVDNCLKIVLNLDKILSKSFTAVSDEINSILPSELTEGGIVIFCIY